MSTLLVHLFEPPIRNNPWHWPGEHCPLYICTTSELWADVCPFTWIYLFNNLESYVVLAPRGPIRKHPWLSICTNALILLMDLMDSQSAQHHLPCPTSQRPGPWVEGGQVVVMARGYIRLGCGVLKSPWTSLGRRKPQAWRPTTAVSYL